MERVKRLIEAGSSITGAIREALGMPTTEFADKYRLPRSSTREVLNAGRRPTDAQLDALVEELGGTREEWRVLLWEAGRPTAAAS